MTPRELSLSSDEEQPVWVATEPDDLLMRVRHVGHVTPTRAASTRARNARSQARRDHRR